MAQFLPSLAPAVDQNGAPLAGAVWEFRIKGTTTPQALLSGGTGATANSSGEFGTLLLDSAKNYRAVLKDSDGKILYEITSVDAGLFDAGVQAALNPSSKPVSGATWSFYASGTSNRLPVFADSDIQTALGAVVEANAAGVFPEIYLDTANTYRAVLGINGTETTIDPVTDANMGAFLSAGFVPPVGPGSGWDGAAGSGFTTTPSDPTRTTAKPAAHLLVPPNQFFTDQLLVVVAAEANNNGTLIGGIDRVRFHFEGSLVEVSSPALHNLGGKVYYGFGVLLQKPEGIEGEAQLYAEVIPADASMQSRVLGPTSFFPSDALHDYELTVAASATEVVGETYQTITGAIEYLKGQSSQNPRIRITEDGLYGIPTTGVRYDGDGYCLIEATTDNVEIGFPSYTTDSAASLRSRYDGLWFKGITFEMRHASSVFHESQGNQHVFENCLITIGGAGRAEMWRSGQRPLGHFAGGEAYFLDCDVTFHPDVFSGASLVRGCTATDIYRDCITDARCVDGLAVNGQDGSIDWAVHVSALTIDGPSGATVSVEGGNDANDRAVVLKEGGAELDRFEVGRRESDYTTATTPGYDATTAGSGYFIQDVADWINSKTGWSATVLDNTRRASALAVPDTAGGAFTDVDVSTGFTFSTYFDIHGDLFQQNLNGPAENVLVRNIKSFDFFAQQIFITSNNGAKDFVFYNCAGAAKSDDLFSTSQVRSNHSHVVLMHISLANQRFSESSGGVTGDSYCLIANNTFSALEVPSSTGYTVTNNHIHTGEIAPVGATGTTIGGDRASLFTDALVGDFTPSGDLLTNQRAPVVAQDIDGVDRANPAPVGALA